MHEQSLVKSLLEAVAREARRAGTGRLTRVRVRLGEFAGVEPGLFELAFYSLSPTTAAAGARLELVPVPLRAECPKCSRGFAVQDFDFHCPACGTGARVVSGEEIVLESLTMEDDPDVRNNSSRRD